MNSVMTVDTSAWWKVIVCLWMSGHPTRMDSGSVNWVILTIFNIPNILRHRKDSFTGLPRWNNSYHANRWKEIEDKNSERIERIWSAILTKFRSRCFSETASRIFYLNIYFCEKRQEGRKLIVEEHLFISFNQPSDRESLRSTACVKPRFGLDLV